MFIVEKSETFIVYNEWLALLKNEHDSFCQIGADLADVTFLAPFPFKTKLNKMVMAAKSFFRAAVIN